MYCELSTVGNGFCHLGLLTKFKEVAGVGRTAASIWASIFAISLAVKSLSQAGRGGGSVVDVVAPCPGHLFKPSHSLQLLGRAAATDAFTPAWELLAKVRDESSAHLTQGRAAAGPTSSRAPCNVSHSLTCKPHCQPTFPTAPSCLPHLSQVHLPKTSPVNACTGLSVSESVPGKSV